MENDLLNPPFLYQEDIEANTVDLLNIAPGIDVIVSTFPGEVRKGDSVAVYFGLNKVADASITTDNPHNFDVPVKVEDILLGTWDVTYRVNGNSSSSNPRRVTFIDSEPIVPALYKTLLRGVYPPGVLSRWIVNADAAMVPSSFLMRSLSGYASDAGTSIALSTDSQGGSEVELGNFTVSSSTWSFSANSREFSLRKGDRLSLSLLGSTNRTIALELAI